jgi:hypothetical protein
MEEDKNKSDPWGRKDDYISAYSHAFFMPTLNFPKMLKAER